MIEGSDEDSAEFASDVAGTEGKGYTKIKRKDKDFDLSNESQQSLK